MHSHKHRTRIPIPAVLGLALVLGCVDGAEEGDPKALREQEATLEGAEGEALSVTSEAPQEIRVGEEFRYFIRVKNTSDEPLQGVVLRDLPPQGFEILDATVVAKGDGDEGEAEDRETERNGRGTAREASGERGAAAREAGMQRGGGQGSGSDLSFQLGRLAPDEEVVVEVVGVAHREGEVQACTLVSYEAPICSDWTVVDPELRAELVLEKDAYWICEEIPVEVKLMNSGTGTVEAGEILFNLPEGLATEDGERQIVMEFDPIEAGESVEEALVLRPERGGEFDLRGMAQTETLSVQSRTSRLIVLEPSVEMTVGQLGELAMGTLGRARIRVENTGRAPVANLVMAVGEAENVEAAEFSIAGEDGSDEVAIGELGPGESRELQLLVRPEDVGQLRMQIVLDGRCLQREDRSIVRELEAKVIGIPAVRLEVIDIEDPVAVGDTTTYRIQVKNQGSADDMGVAVTVNLPEQMEFVEGDGDSGVQEQQDGSIRFGPVERLGPGDIAEWELVVRANQPGDTRLRLQLESEATSSPVLEEEATRVIQQ